MRIYEVVTEYTRGRDRFEIQDRFRIACQTFAQALKAAELHINDKAVGVKSTEVISDTRL
jgi:hypothetical protein